MTEIEYSRPSRLSFPVLTCLVSQSDARITAVLVVSSSGNPATRLGYDRRERSEGTFEAES